MEFSLFKSAAWQLVQQMDWVALLILLGLFCVSVLCIAIIAFKYTIFKRHYMNLQQLLKRLRHVQSFNEVITTTKEFRETLGGAFLSNNMQSLRTVMQRYQTSKVADAEHDQPGHVALSRDDINQLELMVNQNIDNMLLEEEAYLPVLNASASVAPLVGLFGTIWGLIHAFIDISQEKSADIATVAPGMAEALIVTLAGLVVAIPAMIAFFYFSNQLRKFEFNLSEIGDRFLMVVKQHFVK